MQNKNIYFLILEITQEIVEFRFETLLVLVKKMAGEESLANKKRLFALALFLLWEWSMFSTWFDILYLLPAQTRRVAGGRSVRAPARHEAIPSNFLIHRPCYRMRHCVSFHVVTRQQTRCLLDCFTFRVNRRDVVQRSLTNNILITYAHNSNTEMHLVLTS